MGALVDAVGVWPAAVIPVRCGALPPDGWLGRATTVLAVPGLAPDLVVRPPLVPVTTDAVGRHTGEEALVRRVHPEATEPFGAHATAVLRGAVAEPRDRHDGPARP